MKLSFCPLKSLKPLTPLFEETILFPACFPFPLTINFLTSLCRGYLSPSAHLLDIRPGLCSKLSTHLFAQHRTLCTPQTL